MTALPQGQLERPYELDRLGPLTGAEARLPERTTPRPVPAEGRIRPGLRRRRAVKAVVDRVVAAVLLVLLAPLLVAIASAVALGSPGGPLFRQQRIGRHGRPFTILKFRTMTVGSERLVAGLAAGNATDGLLFKVPQDPRVTPVGRALRRTSLDELPQLWNVLRGDMSLVGPRPLPVRPDAFSPREQRRHQVRPGLTGLWQVSGRSDVRWDQAVRLDLDYVDNWSLGLDLLILARTPLAVLRGDGAY